MIGVNPRFDLLRTRVSLFEALLRARDKRGGKALILQDHERRELSYDDIIRAAFAIGGRLKRKTVLRENVGVLLPTGVGCTVAFFALQAIGRVPALLNFTAGAMNLKSACAAAQVKRIVTARAFVELGKYEALVEDLSKHTEIIYLEDVREEIGMGDKLAAAAKAMSPRRFAAKFDPDETGVVLFTSGSFGVPRGAALSHANIVANVEQCYAHVEFKPEWRFFSPLPMFHCLGLTGGALLPLFTGHPCFLYPTPLHAKEIPKLIKEVGANVVLATDTFAQQYARNAKDEDMSSIEIMVCGAERVKQETREAYERRFGVVVLEGYGATEASPVIAVNDPMNNKPGTVGRLLPGVEYKLEPIPGIHEGEKLIVRGPNVMRGYLDPTQPDGVDLLPEGWHDTGDVVSIDEEGFVSILGRVKRFAKVAGEMVSLNAVENYATQVWPNATHAAVALPDARKGERIILFSDAKDAEAAKLVEWLKSNGAPDIAAPKRIVAIEAVPVLGSGKTDYVALQRLAEQRFAEAEAA